MERQRLLAAEGLFDVESGEDLFGPDVAIRTSIDTLTITSGQDGRYAVLRTGCLDNGRAVFEGYWHGPRDSTFGLIRLWGRDAQGGAALCNGTPLQAGDDWQLSGTYGEGEKAPSVVVSLRRTAPLKPFRGRFFSIGHRGACENTDDCGPSSNGLASFRLTDQIGANAVEMDLHLTRDGVPVIFHDASLSGSLVEGAFCRGEIADTSLAELRANCTLQNGEPFPTLEEALRTVIDETELELMYLDTKAAAVVEVMIPMVRAENERARKKGRLFRALVGLPKEAVTDAWKATDTTGVPCLLEYDLDLALELGCVAWGPTWTAGPLVADVERAHAAGLGVFYWTMTQSNFIQDFLEQAKPEGFVTSRTGMVFYLYQKYGTVPEPWLFPEAP